MVCMLKGKIYLNRFCTTLLAWQRYDTEEARAATTMVDRKGWLIDSFTLRGTATKLGYQRSQPQDGAWFDDCRKLFKSAGLTAIIEFTGSLVPEDNTQLH